MTCCFCWRLCVCILLLNISSGISFLRQDMEFIDIFGPENNLSRNTFPKKNIQKTFNVYKKTNASVTDKNPHRPILSARFQPVKHFDLCYLPATHNWQKHYSDNYGFPHHWHSLTKRRPNLLRTTDVRQPGAISSRHQPLSFERALLPILCITGRWRLCWPCERK